jgi:murein DD-endopeptidase MepM/ murein hydrolase activator NlpD
MKPGSVIVRPGDRVPQGQPVGRIGFAGDSIFPHLHYSLMDSLEVFQAWASQHTFRSCTESWERVR